MRRKTPGADLHRYASLVTVIIQTVAAITVGITLSSLFLHPQPARENIASLAVIVWAMTAFLVSSGWRLATWMLMQEEELTARLFISTVARSAEAMADVAERLKRDGALPADFIVRLATDAEQLEALERDRDGWFNDPGPGAGH